MTKRVTILLVVLGLPVSSGCGGLRFDPIIPVGTQPATPADADSFVATFRPSTYHFYRFRAQFQDDRAASRGRGSVRVAAPDSLRFDFQGPLGTARSAAFVVGDVAVWAEPQEEVEKLVPNYPLLWAMLGVPRGPAPGASVRRLSNERVDAWQYVAGPDTVEYVLTRGPRRRLTTDVRHGATRIGRVTTEFGPGGSPVSARLIIPSGPARLDITFYLSQTEAGFAPDTWVFEP